MKKLLAILLAVLMVSGSFAVCCAAELNQEAVSEHYGQYKNYLLLGDSAASGYRDEITEDDELFNETNNETVYCRVPGSYADVLADAIIEDKSMTSFAAPGYRTIEMRYMLEDDFAAACEDEYLFHTSHLYVYEDQLAPDGSGEYLLPGAEYFRKEFKKAIAQADLISLGVGGNDWGAYLGWVIADILEAENVADEYIEQAKELLEAAPVDVGTIEKFVEIAHIAGALPTLLQQLPERLNYGLENFYTNWDIMIQDIYDLNPDVTLMVIGMSDNSLKGKYYDYNGVEGEPVNDPEAETDATKEQVMSTIIDFIMSVGNAPMIEGADKFGYIYVDTDGTTYVESHPDADGHIFIANKIIEALPDPVVSKQFTDVTPGHNSYKAIEYVVANGIMTGTSETTFSPDEAITKGQLNAATNAINGTSLSTESESEASVVEVAVALFASGIKKGPTGFIKGLTAAFKILSRNAFSINGTVSRAQAAEYLKSIAEA